MRSTGIGMVLVVLFAACLGDPVGPRGTIVLRRVGTTDSVLVGAPGRPLTKPIAFQLIDGDGRPVPAASVTWRVVGGNGHIERASTISDKDGNLSAVWVLGTHASDRQQLTAEVAIGSHQAGAELQAVAVPVQVASLAFQAETTEVRLTLASQLHVIATDPYGNQFRPLDLRFAALDTTLTVDTAGVVTPHHRGFAHVTASAGGVTATAVVHGIQVVTAILVDHDTLHFHSLGENAALAVTLRDDQGLPVLDSLPAIVPSDSTVIAVQANAPVLVKSHTNGIATITLSTSTVSRSVVAVVRQHTATLSFAAPSYSFDALNDTTRTRLIALDSLGVPVQSPRLTFSSSDSSVVAIDSTGLLYAHGNGSAMVRAQALSGVAASVPTVVAQQVARIGVTADTLSFKSLHAILPMGAIAEDRLGYPVTAARLTYASVGGGIASVDTTGRIEALTNGTTRILAVYGASASEVVVQIRQRPVRVVVTSDTLRLSALGQGRIVSAVAQDSLGYPLAAGVTGVAPADTSVARAVDSATVVSRANGVTSVTFTVAGLPGQVQIRVAQVPARVQVVSPPPQFDAINDTSRAASTVTDSLGNLIAFARVTYASSDSMVATVDSEGVIHSHGNGTATLVARAGAGVVSSVPITVAQQVSRVSVTHDTIEFNALHAVLPVAATAFDRLGSPIENAVFKYAAGNTVVVTVDSTGSLRATGNGITRVTASVGADTAAVVVQVMQRPVRVQVASDTIRITAIGDTAMISATALDSLGSALSGAAQVNSVSDPSVLDIIGMSAVRARTTGSSNVGLLVAGLSGTVRVQVSPVPASIEAALVVPPAITSLPLDSLLPISCRVLDRNGNVIDTAPSVVASNGGRWTGSRCGQLRAQHSGFDTVRVQAGAVQAEVPVVLAIRPIASSQVGDFVQFDSIPTGTAPWAPTARRNSNGQIEIYFAAYQLVEPPSALLRTDLHRMVSSDGVHFTYDGVVLRHDADSCGVHGSGIENVSIVPRPDGPGWRMFYSAGSFPCYGWQVFSAVSTDERTWIQESGVRLTNGGTLPPVAPMYAPWPVGEGMEVDQSTPGNWTMLVGGYEHILPYEDKFQIVKWTSSDQLSWSYEGPMLSTRDMPAGGQGTIYSPNVRQVAPGLWRMIFNGDNRKEPGWRGRIWSAVSTDQRVWQVEGEVMGSPQTRLWYGSLVDDLLVLIRQDFGDQRRLASARIAMP